MCELAFHTQLSVSKLRISEKRLLNSIKKKLILSYLFLKMQNCVEHFRVFDIIITLFVVFVLGLTNENLEHQRVFDDNLYRMMELFLERLETPICLVAHNGNRFDYPILQSELCKIQKVRALKCLLSSELNICKF